MIKCNMIKIFKLPKYDKTQYDKHFGIFYHMALSKYDKKNNLCPQGAKSGFKNLAVHQFRLTNFIFAWKFFVSPENFSDSKFQKNTQM